MMAANTRCKQLIDLDEYIRRADTAFGNRIHTELFHILDVQRFIVDTYFCGLTGVDPSKVVDAYDLTLSDGLQRRKVVLAPHHNDLVQTRKVAVGGHVRLLQCQSLVDDTDLLAIPAIYVEDLETGVVDDGHAHCCRAGLLPWKPMVDRRQQIKMPLLANRGFYLQVWRVHALGGHSDLNPVMTEESEEEVWRILEEAHSLEEVITEWSSLQKQKPGVCVRVLRRSRLLHFSKPTGLSKWPLQLTVDVADMSGCCCAIFWNSLAVQMDKVLKDGDVLLLRNFKVKPDFGAAKGGSSSGNLGGQRLDAEVSLNSSNPVAEVTLISPEALPTEAELPGVLCHFISQTDLGVCSDGDVCDVVGVVMYISRPEREPVMCAATGQRESGGFWLRHWVLLQDSSSQTPILLQLYTGLKGVDGNPIHPGCLLVCRHLRIVVGPQVATADTAIQDVCLTSTVYTMMQVFSRAEELEHSTFSSEAEVQAFLHWVKQARTLRGIRAKGVMGGYFSPPGSPTSLQQLEQSHGPLQITSCVEWQNTLTQMAFAEFKVIFTQARLVKVTALACEDTRARPQTRQMRKQPVSNQHQQEVVLDETWARNRRRFTRVGGLPDDAPGLMQEVFPWPYRHLSNMEELDLSHISASHSSEHEGRPPVSGDLLVTTWRGLNGRLELSALLPMPPLPPSPSLPPLLMGEYSREHSLPQTPSTNPPKRVTALLQSAVKVHEERFLLVLHLYSVDGENTQVILHRAFQVS